SETLIKGILRENFGFGGAVISDWGAVCDRVRGLQAGMDLEMPGGASGNERVIVQAVLCGELETTKLDAAVRNVLELVARCRALPESVQKCDYAANGALSRRAAAECAVLMKNDCGLLPLDKNKKIAVIGRFAQKARYQGAGSSLVNSRETSSALEEFAGIGMDCVYAEGYNDDGSTNDALLAKSREAVASAGRAVIFAGLPESCESEGYDRAGLELPDGMLKLIDVICSETSEVAVVLMLGAPVLLPFEPRVRSILCMYLGGEHAGAASVDVLTGARNPSGSLAETWPRSIADTPCAAYYGKKRKECEYREGIYVGYRYYEGAGVAPLYKFGHGLSYTRFEIDALSCPRTTLTDGEELEMSVRVRNVGAHEGTKTLFAFVKERDGDLVQLKSFEKVALNAGEQARITIKLDFDAFCYYNRALGKRCAKAGKYIVRLCGSLDDAGESVEISLDPADGREPPPYITAGEAPSVGDERFEQMLGFLPCEPPMRPYTLNSTLGELSRTAVGKLLLSVAESTVFSGQNELAPENEQTVRRSMLDVPIRALCALSKGALPPNLARAVVCFANGKIARGIKYAVKRKN
ncbi:MAG: glycoside hydrolase family 3 C-terminal domain-containing protein, partial [Oscillospiraceae bacterium]